MAFNEDESDEEDNDIAFSIKYKKYHTRNSKRINSKHSQSNTSKSGGTIDLSMTSDEEDDDMQIIYDKKWKFEESGYKDRNITLLKQNIDELNNGSELNQDLIDFAVFYEYSKWDPSFRKSCYLLPCQFWRYLSESDGKLGLENASKCYKKIGNDIMKRKYIIFVKGSVNHWVLVIIANPNINKIIGDHEPCIIILDSARKGATYYRDDCKRIREWLNFEMKCKKYNASSCKHLIPDIPQQKGAYNCGLFVWRNLIYFAKEQGFKDTISEKKLKKRDWCNTDEGNKGRQELIEIIRRL